MSRSVISTESIKLLLSEDNRTLTLRLYGRPILFDESGCFYSIYKGEYFQLYRYDGELVICSWSALELQGDSLSRYEARSIPMERLSSLEQTRSSFCFEIMTGQFGPILTISALPKISEMFVDYLVNTERVLLRDWEVVEDSCEIKFPRGVSGTAVENLVHSFATDGAKYFSTLIYEYTEAELNKRKVELELERKNVYIDELEKGVFKDDLDAENRIAALQSNVVELEEELNYLLKTEQRELKVKKSRYGNLINLLLGVFPNLAFAPTSLEFLYSRFELSTDIWRVLSNLNIGTIPFVKLKGVAGSNGWREAKDHINTGKDNRGRVYFRESTERHSFDVVVHWKKSDKEQARFIDALSSYSPFQDVDVVRS